MTKHNILYFLLAMILYISCVTSLHAYEHDLYEAEKECDICFVLFSASGTTTNSELDNDLIKYNQKFEKVGSLNLSVRPHLKYPHDPPMNLSL
jgi:hypothetical protein